MTIDSSATENTGYRIAIVLSTYNGAEHLDALLESLQQQKFTGWDLWVRDDGSNDQTVRILQEFRHRLLDFDAVNRVFLKEGENIGVVRSFFQLLSEIEGSYAGYAFCDQDDIWHPDKLQRAVDELARFARGDTGGESGDDHPWLYHSRQWLMDNNGSLFGKSPLPKRTGLANALIQNQVVGCTMVINNRMRKLIMDGFERLEHEGRNDTGRIQSRSGRYYASHSHPMNAIIMHDWWCYLLATAFGSIHFDTEPTIRFRRHEASSTPAATSWLKSWIGRAFALKKRSWRISHIPDQAATFYRLYVKTDDSISGLFTPLIDINSAGLLKRLHYLFTGPHHRSTRFETLMFRIMILLRR